MPSLGTRSAGRRSDFPDRVPRRPGAAGGDGGEQRLRGLRRRRQRLRHPDRGAAAGGFSGNRKESGDRCAEEERHHRGQSRGDEVRLRQRHFGGRQADRRQDPLSQVAAQRSDQRSHRPGQRADPRTGDRLSGRDLRAALATLAVRATIPDAEKLSLLPFTFGDLAGFHVENVLPGRAVMLIDTPDGVPTDKFDARMFVAAFDGGPGENEDHGQFARMTFGQIVGIKDVQITMSEPLRIGGQSGFQTMAQAKDMKTGDDIMVAQWLRFGTGGFMQMIGMAKADVWTTALTRLRAVRDGIQLK